MVINNKLKKTVERRLYLQNNYAPKLRSLVETRTDQLNFSVDQRNAAEKSMDALIWKLTAAGIHLERLWQFKESEMIKRLFETVNENRIDPRCFTDNEVAYLTLEFEAFLIQARSFISIAQIHTLHACGIPYNKLLTNEKYGKIIQKKPYPPDKLVNAKLYFDKNVFNENRWGFLLKSLRDRVIHYDRIRPTKFNIDDIEELSVRGLSLEKLAQEFENGYNSLLVDVITPIWDRKWIPGPFRKDMWY
ncbi:MAG: hypothetical protein R6W90_17370 [Ignavibacteriaceae bacterium]